MKQKKIFYEKTKLNENNEKIIFLITNSKFNEVYKRLKQSKLYKLMANNINYILCYLSI